MATAPPQTGRILRFGTFELDLAAGELSKNGRKVRLQEQPFQLLTALVEKPAEVITREELKDRLWPGDTYVDFDRSLNTAASKLRDALGDSASSPRFIETLPRRGYRFLASVTTIADGAGGEIQPDGFAAQATQQPADGLSAQKVTSRRLVAGASVALIGLALAAAAFWSGTPSSTAAGPAVRFTLPLEHDVRWPVVSPDGRKIAYQGGTAIENAIWVQDFGDWEPRKIEGTDQGRRPFWSPDSAWIGFERERELMKASADGGTPTRVCRLPENYFRGGTWSPDGKSIVFSVGNAQVYEVPALGGEPRPVSIFLASPHFLPMGDGRRVLLGSLGDKTSDRIRLIDLDTGEDQLLAEGAYAAYSGSGHIVYQTARVISGIEAVPFSLKTLQVTGGPFPVASQAWEPSVSDGGTLVYRHAAETRLRLAWRDRGGNVVAQSGVAQENIRYPTLSPDESRIAVSALEGDDIDIWVHELRRGVKRRLTTLSRPEFCPIWSPSGTEIVFSRFGSSSSRLDLALARADGSGEAVSITATEWDEFATDWGSDGNYILYDRNGADGRNDVWYLERKGDEWSPVPFLESRFDQRAARFSPDGKHVAYVSNKSGEHEVYVTGFPDGRQEWKASEGGGVRPVWSKDGAELYYVDARAVLHSVAITRDPELLLGQPTRLFQASGLDGTYVPNHDVSSDGRFLVREPSGDNRVTIRVMQNWFEEFREK